MEIIDKCWARIQLFSLHYLPFFCLRLPSRRSKINQLKHSFINIFLSTLSLPLLFIGINKPKFTRLVLFSPKYINNIDSLFPAHPCIINVPNKTVRSLLDHHRNFLLIPWWNPIEYCDYGKATQTIGISLSFNGLTQVHLFNIHSVHCDFRYPVRSCSALLGTLQRQPIYFRIKTIPQG